MNDLAPHINSVESKKYQYHFSAFSIGSVAATRIPNEGVVGHVHSVFRHVINMEIPGKGLVSLVGHETGRGPLYICVEIPEYIDLTTIGMARGNNVLRVGNVIVFRDNVLAISIENATLWEPKRKLNGIFDTPEPIRSNLAAMHQLAIRSPNISGLGQLLEYSGKESMDETTTKVTNPVARLAQPHVIMLLKAIKLGNSQKIVHSVQNLLGLGHGLTPSGDDFLVGLMLSMSYIAANLNIEQTRVRDALKDIESCIHHRTTTISEEFLLQAAIGNANETVLILIETLLTSKPNDVKHAARKVLDIGGTSGTDTILGIFLGFNLLLNGT